MFLRAEHLARVARHNTARATLPEALNSTDKRLQKIRSSRSHMLGAQPSPRGTQIIPGAASDVAPEQPQIDAEKALALQPDLPEAHLALAHCASDRFDYPNALEHLARAQALAPQSAEVYAILGSTYALQMRFEEAVRMSQERATHYDPGNARMFINLSNVYWWAGRIDKVEAPLKRAIVLDPTADAASFTLAEFLIFERGDIEGARKLLRRDKPSLAYSYIFTRENTKPLLDCSKNSLRFHFGGI